ncbi:MAG: hypothetical protein F6K25_07570 [Okeania sp. SIO2G4]|uniref:hypothetical protein n=1 Tax=unclassified Okeania TaxID=2634635 RepID=UPI0013B6ED03|nr:MULTISPECIES: hypothetical protein [unclassified Okeania]NEP08373.1 hypothetical protein [Okeania sp. SIO4D6]NEP75102.1 hypothetical protein [Okeania sp. SIO2G5]NEP93178.1 hypothetical protein [Okeania sp. SIO2F5]NEQ90582.1 hypothetical protein [Okeania sp. SIO2G4]
MSSIIPVIFVWFVTLFGACVGIVIGGTIGGIVGAITNLITKFRCTMRIFNAATFTSLLSTFIFIVVAHQKIQPLNCADGLDGFYACFSPLLIPFWGAIIGGIFGSFIGVIMEIYTKSNN